MSHFERLHDDTKILMINQDIFTVARLKQLISQKLHQKLVQKPSNNQRNFASNFRQNLFLNEEAVSISMKDIQFTFPKEGMDCQLLNLNTKEWQLGKLRMFADIQVVPSGTHGNDTSVKINELKLEFATDEQPTSDLETSLDAI